METDIRSFWNDVTELVEDFDGSGKETIKNQQPDMSIPKIIDHKVTLLAAAGAAMSADCRPCLEEVMPELEEAGISEADVKWAMQNGQFSGTQAELGAFALEQICEASRTPKNDCFVK